MDPEVFFFFVSKSLVKEENVEPLSSIMPLRDVLQKDSGSHGTASAVQSKCLTLKRELDGLGWTLPFQIS